MPSEGQDTPARTITKIGEDLYWVQSNIHYSVFLVTDQGIILVDPINRGFSEWLKGQLEERFDVPVRYVLYSHHHPDHASGGAVFEDTAQFIGHENMIPGLAERDPPPDVIPPNVTYKDRMTIRLGGKAVELIYAGVTTHSNDLSIVRFPDANAIFSTDFIVGRQVPGIWPVVGAQHLDAWLNAIRLAESLDYEIFAPGHGEVGSRTDVAANRRYLEELRDQVSVGLKDGRSLEELQESIQMRSYQDWARYDDLHRRNVEAMYNILTD